LLIIEIEDVIDVVEFLLVGLLGFMPLIIIHFADRVPRVRVLRLGRGLGRWAVAARTGLLVALTNWANWWVA